jgi:hypothetical protein
MLCSAENGLHLARFERELAVSVVGNMIANES